MTLRYGNGFLEFGELHPCSLLSLVKNTRTPFYLYDLDGMRGRVRALKATFPGLKIHYAMKANGAKQILDTFYQEGTGIDVVSGGEIQIALNRGFLPNQILFSGVGKTKDEIELAVQKGIRQINVESPEELKRICSIAGSLQKKTRIAFRVNPDVDAKTHPYITTGFRENKFGMGKHFFPELLNILKNNSQVELCGLTLHIGSQLQDLSPLSEAIAMARDAFEEFRRAGHPLRSLDVGGGIGIFYQKEHQTPSLDYQRIEEYGKLLGLALKGFDGEVLCEPGRILTASSGVLVGEVQYVKETPFRNFLILNTGMHHLLRPSLYQAYHRILPLLEGRDRPTKVYDVVGPICESSDVLGKDRHLPETKAEEFLAVADSGAYGFSMASSYNEHQPPEEIFWENGRIR